MKIIESLTGISSTVLTLDNLTIPINANHVLIHVCSNSEIIEI